MRERLSHGTRRNTALFGHLCIASKASCMYVKLRTPGPGYAANSILAFASVSEPVF